MTPTRTPEWWTDVLRSREAALDDYEHILGLLDRFLARGDDLSGTAVHRDARRWTELLIMADSSAQRLKAADRLAEARRRDAMASGLIPPKSDALDARAARASLAGRELVSRLQSRMAAVTEELRRRRPRRPAAGIYRNPTASHVNLYA